MYAGSGSGTSDSTASSAVWSSTSETLPAFAASESLPISFAASESLPYLAQNTQLGDHSRAPGTSVADSALDIDSLHEIKQEMDGTGDWEFPWCGQDEEGARDGAPSPCRRTTAAIHAVIRSTLPFGW